MARHADLEVLEGQAGLAIRLDEPVARHSALRMGGEVEAWVLACDEDAVKAALAGLRAAGLTLRRHQPLGDHYAREEGLAGALLRLGPAFGTVEIEDDLIRVGAAVPMAQLGVVACRAGLADWAPVARWPGTVAAWLEAGEAEALAPLLRSVRALVGRSVKDRPGSSLASLSSKAVILGAELEARHGRPLPPPPPPPGTLLVLDEKLEKAMRRSRLPGLRLRSIRLASEQPGVVVNLGAGSSRDLELIIRLVKERLKRDHGLEVEARLQPLGRPPRANPRSRDVLG